MTLDQLIASVRASISTRLAERETHTQGIAAIRDTLTSDTAELSADQARQVQDHDTARGALDAQIEQLRVREADLLREQAADAAATVLQGEVHPADTRGQAAGQARVGEEANPVYRRGDLSTSYFRDLYGAVRGDRQAQDRLARSQERAATSSSATNGGVFAPPAWLVDEFIAVARAGRVTADLMNGPALPGGVSSINIPKITGGTGVAVTQTQNTTITETAVTTTSVSSGITTISGKQTVSIELLRQSATPIDQVILQDLAQAYAVALDIQVIRGSGANGQLRGLVTAGTSVAFTTTQPAVVSATAANNFYSKVLGAKDALESTRFLPATAIVMHSRRWNWILAGQDSQLRPIVAPAQVPNLNGIGTANDNGFAGHTLAGLPVFIDANIDTTTEQVFVLRTDDLWLWESEPEMASFEATLADQNSVLFRVLGFAAFIPDRYNYAAANVAGTGLAAPVF